MSGNFKSTFSLAKRTAKYIFLASREYISIYTLIFKENQLFFSKKKYVFNKFLFNLL